MRNLNLFPLLFATAAMFSACESDQSRKEVLLDYLGSSASDGAILLGHQDALMYGHSWVADPNGDFDRSDIKDVCGAHPAVLGLDLGGIEIADSANLDGNPFDAMRKAALAHYQRGGIVTLSWHPRNPLTGGDAWDVSSDQAVASIIEGGEKHEDFMGWLSLMTDYLKTFKSEDGDLIPMIFRPWHEHTGSWFWWGQNLCTREQYLKLWKMTYDWFEEEGLDNLLWAYSPGAGPDAHGYMERYPGDEMVDMLGVDCYQYGSSEDYIDQMRETLDFMEIIGAEHGKLIAVTETGCEGIPSATWWTETFLPAIDGYDLAYVLVWRNAHDKPGHFYAPWPDTPSAPDFSDLLAEEKIKLLK